LFHEVFTLPQNIGTRVLIACFARNRFACYGDIPALADPRIIVISLDGATPRIVKDLLKSGALPDNSGIGLLKLLSPEPGGWIQHHQLYSSGGADIVMESVAS
jgi:hypothetical protein